jgi:regulator of sirC expression with transglutaminase-like and TPR domain
MLMDPALRAFAATVGTADPDIDLARAALLIAEIEHPTLSLEDYLRALDVLAARSQAARAEDPLRRLHRLREFMFEEERFRGNGDEYYDPRNSCLNDVLDRRLGIPITLSLVVIELGRRVGLDIAGIGLPGHFVVSASIGGDHILLDPFNGGEMLTHETAAALVARAVGRRLELSDENFAPVAKRQVLTRMLNNLKAIYWKREDWDKTLAVIDRLLLLDPSSAAELRDRGTILVNTGECRRGLADWERYLTSCPDAADAPTVKRRLRQVRQALAALN